MKNPDFFKNTQYDLFQERNVHFSILGTKIRFKIKTTQNIGKCLFLKVLRNLLPILNCLKHTNFQHFCQNYCTLLHILPGLVFFLNTKVCAEIIVELLLKDFENYLAAILMTPHYIYGT
jgi:hypothetical protein